MMLLDIHLLIQIKSQTLLYTYSIVTIALHSNSECAVLESSKILILSEQKLYACLCTSLWPLSSCVV